MSATASGASLSGRLSRAVARRACACSWRPMRCSTPAHAVVSLTRRATDSSGTSSMLSSRARCPSANCPVAASAPANARSSSTRSSAGVASGRSRSAPANQRAALAGARRAATSPASRRVATAATSPWRAARSTWWARAEADAPRSRERLGGTLVRAEPPASGRRLVDRPAHERMPESEPPGDVRLAHEVESQQLVKRVERRRLASPRRRRGQLGIERIAGHRGTLEHATCPVREQGELLRQRRDHRRRNLRGSERGLRQCRAPPCRDDRTSARAARGRRGCRRSPRRDRTRRGRPCRRGARGPRRA